MPFIAKPFAALTGAEVYEILKARSEVFLLEQKICCLDMDNIDYQSLHCFLWEDGSVTAYLRAFYTAPDTVKIGRVLTLRHGTGTGRALMEQSLSAIREKMPCQTLTMDAQKYAAGFYEKFGFRQTSGDFLEENIVHVAMERAL